MFHMQQISLQYFVELKNYTYLNLKQHFFVNELVIKRRF